MQLGGKACSSIGNQNPIALAALVRPVVKRRQRQLAGRTGRSNAASGWGTHDLATAIQTVTKS